MYKFVQTRSRQKVKQLTNAQHEHKAPEYHECVGVRFVERDENRQPAAKEKNYIYIQEHPERLYQRWLFLEAEEEEEEHTQELRRKSTKIINFLPPRLRDGKKLVGVGDYVKCGV